MSEMIDLTAADGATIGAYRATPSTKPKGGLVVVQEIFGVNPHIRRVTDGFAAEGYIAVAPAFFDRVKPGVELGYDADGMTEGRGYVERLDRAQTLLDLEAAVKVAAEGGKVGVVGFCWGGSIAYLAACETSGVAAAVGYYGGQIAKLLDRRPRVPLMLHFGEFDKHIPMSDVEAIRAALPEVPVFTYRAEHGFNCDARGSYDKASAVEAMDRTLDFLSNNLG